MYQGRALREEEILKDSVYASFDNMIHRANAEAISAQQEYNSGRYEDQESAVVAGHTSHVKRKAHETKKELGALYERPYFAHLRLVVDEDDEVNHYLLSNSETLDRTIDIDASEPCCIIPFMQTKNRPLLEKLRLFYASPSEEKIRVVVHDTRSGDDIQTIYSPQLVRNVDIRTRKLNGINTLFDIGYSDEESADEQPILVDDLLEIRLEENRADARLRNIIATLQRQQFQIIQTEIGKSFVVQGCAGSGKTQCMLHRLFFLRESLSDTGWDKVLLITPTQLFRYYSSELMKSYRLTDVSNYTLAEFYRTLLEAFDDRFRNRQYAFELTEEYLPDEYLRQVYAPEQIAAIDREIRRAIRARVEEGCQLLEKPIIQDEIIDISLVKRIENDLADAISRYDEIERSLAADPEYDSHRTAMDDLDKQLKTLERRQRELLEVKERLISEKKQYDALCSDLESASAELEAWKRKSDADIMELSLDHQKCAVALDNAETVLETVELARKYVQALFQLRDATENHGQRYQYDAEYRELLEAIVYECREKLQVFTKRQTPATWIRNYEQRLKNNATRMIEIQEDIDINLMYQDDHRQWLEAHNVEDAKKQHRAHRDSLERARYYLNRIESSVFEQEVWNALAPLKERCGIMTVQIDALDNNRQKQTRILYKSDLLFYVRIYLALRGTDSLPAYNMICIDEGQDLHSVDYAMLREIYPRAALNIFGDKDQVLHEACGISDWEHDTGVETIFEMNSNYRNTPAIVDFCNRMYGETMAYCGKIHEAQKPVMIDNANKARELLDSEAPVIIVKDREAYMTLLSEMRCEEEAIAFLDTRELEMPLMQKACYSIFAAKGLEFTKALVFARGMTRNQRIVACTRAMERLYYYE